MHKHFMTSKLPWAPGFNNALLSRDIENSKSFFKLQRDVILLFFLKFGKPEQEPQHTSQLSTRRRNQFYLVRIQSTMEDTTINQFDDAAIKHNAVSIADEVSCSVFNDTFVLFHLSIVIKPLSIPFRHLLIY